MPDRYFDSPETATRYAWARPDLAGLFTPGLLRHTGRLSAALDVGCGTGMSTRALTAVADHVTGVDAAEAMLAETRPAPGLRFCAARAESLPFRDASFELVVAGLAFHWFERDDFLREASRILDSAGWLFIYNTWFQGSLVDCPSFAQWWRAVYLSRHPSPPRGPGSLAPADAASHRFRVVDDWTITTEVAMSMAEFAAFLTTQSNVVSSVRREQRSLEEVDVWLRGELEPFFKKGSAMVQFGGRARLLRRSS